MTLSSVRQNLIKRLTPAVGDREARAMVGLILENRCNITPIDIAVNPDKNLSDETVSNLNEITDKVIAGEPLQYVLGVAPFHGLSIAVSPVVLI
ncbi:MAG: peptide chain release factor N(5)-glutamine methyltransferase, partial [Muribaculaceae bacterium]|nr:peptide chain release factor N(5)-glutamine methyltransferase [Muribaculaceae bacterium]